MPDRSLQLPEDIRSRAFVTTSEDTAWRLADLPTALSAIVEAGGAILGAEAWCIRDGSIWPAIPLVDSDIPAIWGWSARRRGDDESWSDFCPRTLREGLAKLSESDLRDLVRPQALPYVWVEVTYVSQQEYEDLGRMREFEPQFDGWFETTYLDLYGTQTLSEIHGRLRDYYFGLDETEQRLARRVLARWSRQFTSSEEFRHRFPDADFLIPERKFASKYAIEGFLIPNAKGHVARQLVGEFKMVEATRWLELLKRRLTSATDPESRHVLGQVDALLEALAQGS